MTVSGLKHDGNFTTADGKAAVLADAQAKDWDISLTEAMVNWSLKVMFYLRLYPICLYV